MYLVVVRQHQTTMMTAVSQALSMMCVIRRWSELLAAKMQSDEEAQDVGLEEADWTTMLAPTRQ